MPGIKRHVNRPHLPHIANNNTIVFAAPHRITKWFASSQIEGCLACLPLASIQMDFKSSETLQ
jgi:hypothetical protein